MKLLNKSKLAANKETPEIKEDKKVLKVLVDSFYISYEKLLKSVEKKREIEKELGKDVLE